MMEQNELVLRVRSYRDAAPGAPLEARFGSAGGHIGRAPGNTLTLDDPGKYISRVHASIDPVGGQYRLTDQGANPSLVNGQPVGAGASAMLADGDRLEIGDYLLDVAISSVAGGVDDTLCDALARSGILQGQGGAPLADPLGLAFDMPVPAAPAVRSDHVPPERHALPPAPVHLQIPDDYDPLASLLLQPAPAAAPAPAPPPPPQPSPMPAAGDAVLRALLDGLGLPTLQYALPPEELARLAGAMLRAATAGTMEVLMARALTKRDSHIDMTMIAPRENNPLKFFPDPDTALAQMFGAGAPGYLAPLAAVNAAFDDLKAHELAVIAGMRAALGAVAQRFDPARIEARLAPPDRIERWLPARRKAHMWDRLVELYGELSRDADEDLQRLFGERFSSAYQEQVARMRRPVA